MVSRSAGWRRRDEIITKILHFEIYIYIYYHASNSKTK